MWAANAATVVPSCDAADRRVHLVPANLQQMLHRSIEASMTTRVLRAIFSNGAHFVVHDPLPGGGQLADEGAANHIRLATSRGAVHLFAWGRSAFAENLVGPRHHPARQTLEASHALARLHQLQPERCFFPQQHPAGIDAGAFHTDVMAVGCGDFLMVHDLAFVDEQRLLGDLRQALGDELLVVRATAAELSAGSAVAAYPFNSQVLALPGGRMAIVAPDDSGEDPQARSFLERVAAAKTPTATTAPTIEVHYVDVRQSMHNGGGPACLRLRVPLTEDEARALSANVVLTDALYEALCSWIGRHYRERLVPGDLADPELAREGMRALDELSQLLNLGSIYDFQRS
jgi:succinylarginine dihydrolase